MDCRVRFIQKEAFFGVVCGFEGVIREFEGITSFLVDFGTVQRFVSMDQCALIETADHQLKLSAADLALLPSSPPLEAPPVGDNGPRASAAGAVEPLPKVAAPGSEGEADDVALAPTVAAAASDKAAADAAPAPSATSVGAGEGKAEASASEAAGGALDSLGREASAKDIVDALSAMLESARSAGDSAKHEVESPTEVAEEKRSSGGPTAAVTSAGPDGEVPSPLPVFNVGDQVKYWSAKHGKWVNAHVQRVFKDSDGTVSTYDLTAKVQADIRKIRPASYSADAPPPPGFRRPAAVMPPVASVEEVPVPAPASPPALPAFAPAQVVPKTMPKVVEYWSDSKHRWVQSTVEFWFERAETTYFDLACKRSVSSEKVRYQKDKFIVGDAVAYWSNTANRFLQARVVSVNEKEEQCDLDIKPTAAMSRLRKLVQGARISSGSGSSKGSRAKKALGVTTPPARPSKESDMTPSPPDAQPRQKVSPAPPLSCGFSLGDKVQYWSNSKRRWLEATVVGLREQANNIVYDLDCKSGTPADRVRASPAASALRQYSVGDCVEYWSNSAGRWLPAKVMRMCLQQKVCDLDVKPAAPFGRLRPLPGPPLVAAGTAASAPMADTPSPPSSSPAVAPQALAVPAAPASWSAGKRERPSGQDDEAEAKRRRSQEQIEPFADILDSLLPPLPPLDGLMQFRPGMVSLPGVR